MHMADALLSPAVGATMWTATAATTFYCAKRLREEPDPARVPLMGVVGAFVFAAQMINFTIPGTGSSGHLGGGLILAVLLGPEAALLVMASVLTVQALFFADGGLLALGANIFNLGFFPAFVAYPFIFRPLAGRNPSTGRLAVASVIAAVVSLQLGALGVVLETTLSGVSALPLLPFAAVMLPIHLAIGIVEGLVTAAVVVFVSRAQPEILARTSAGEGLSGVATRSVIAVLGLAAVAAGVFLSLFASASPDGLEWSIANVAGTPELEAAGLVYEWASAIQERLAFLPDYSLGASESAAGTSVSGAVGAAITLALVVGVGALLAWRVRRRDSVAGPGDEDG